MSGPASSTMVRARGGQAPLCAADRSGLRPVLTVHWRSKVCGSIGSKRALRLTDQHEAIASTTRLLCSINGIPSGFDLAADRAIPKQLEKKPLTGSTGYSSCTIGAMIAYE